MRTYIVIKRLHGSDRRSVMLVREDGKYVPWPPVTWHIPWGMNGVGIRLAEIFREGA